MIYLVPTQKQMSYAEIAIELKENRSNSIQKYLERIKEPNETDKGNMLEIAFKKNR